VKLLASAGIEELTLDNFDEFEEKVLGNFKMSLRKQECLVQALAFFRREKVIWSELSEEEVRRKLTAIPGIGKWTADMILLFTLGRPDIFPAEDYHLKGIFDSCTESKRREK